MADTQSAAALQSRYRNTLDRKERRQILADLIAEQGLTPENELRQSLLDARYDTQKGQDVDRFLYGWIVMGMASHRMGGGGRRKDCQEALDTWQASKVAEYGEAGRAVWQDELYNVVLLYIDLCQKDKNYNSILWGIGTIKEDSRIAKVAKEVARLAYGVPKDAGMTEEFAPFTAAAREAFLAMYPREQGELDAQVQKVCG